MPVLAAGDTLRHSPRRILVAGSSGAGKTSTAARLATVLEVRHTEIDGLFHGPGWTVLPSFHAEVERLCVQPSWITEWQYNSVRPLLGRHADTLLWLDYSRSRVMRQLVRRTLRRRLTRQELWNGNVEPPLHTFFTDPDHVIRWSWRKHHERRAQVRELSLSRPDLQVVHVRSPRELDRWFAGSLARWLAARSASGASQSATQEQGHEQHQSGQAGPDR